MTPLRNVATVLFAFCVLFPVGCLHWLTSWLVRGMALFLERPPFGEYARPDFEGLVYENSYQPLPREVLLQQHVVSGTQRWSDGTWVHPHERLKVEREFYRLVRDHTDQRLADFLYASVMASVEAYSRAEPRVCKPSFCLAEERNSPQMVRTDEECAATSRDELFDEIAANAEEVARIMVPSWTAHLAMVERPKLREVGS